MRRISVRGAVAAPHHALAAGLRLDDHLLHHVVQPRQLARMGHARQDEEHQRDRCNQHAPNGDRRPTTAVLGRVTHSFMSLN